MHYFNSSWKKNEKRYNVCFSVILFPTELPILANQWTSDFCSRAFLNWRINWAKSKNGCPASPAKCVSDIFQQIPTSLSIAVILVCKICIQRNANIGFLWKWYVPCQICCNSTAPYRGALGANDPMNLVFLSALLQFIKSKPNYFCFIIWCLADPLDHAVQFEPYLGSYGEQQPS